MATNQRQAEKPWDIDNDLAWGTLDTTKPLLPLERLPLPESFTQRERLVLSQFLGLMAIQAIAGHEEIIGAIEAECTRQVRQAGNQPPMLAVLMQQFFIEEAKHSQAFARYVGLFSRKSDIPQSLLMGILPTMKRSSWITRAFLLNHSLGGNAVWRLVQLTELESIDLFRYLRSSGIEVDSVYYDLNRLHYEEETRHISVPPQILSTVKAGNRIGLEVKFARAMHTVWAFTQFFRLRHLASLKNEHEFFATLYSAYRKVSFRQKLSLLRSIQVYVMSGRRLHTQLKELRYES